MMMRAKAANLKGFTNFVTSGETIAVASAIFLTPVVSRFIVPLLGNIPYLNQHPTIVLVIASLIVFMIAKATSGTIRSIILGAAAGLFINAIASTGVGATLIGRLQANR